MTPENIDRFTRRRSDEKQQIMSPAAVTSTGPCHRSDNIVAGFDE